MALKVSSMVADHMVLQRDKPWVLHGHADPEATVSVTFLPGKDDGSAPRPAPVTADKKGNWQVAVGTFEASPHPHELTIIAKSAKGSDKLIVRDIVIGDVWLLGGQSNMQLWLSRTAHNFPEAMEQTDPLLRLVDIPQEVKFDGPRDPLALDKVKWKSMKPKTAPDFSAVGYFFGAKLRARYGVPIGLIAAAVGGTPIASWLSRPQLDQLGIDTSAADKYSDLTAANQIVAAEQTQSEQYQNDMDKADKGLIEQWAAPGFDDSDWGSSELTELAAGAGAYWYRKTLKVPPAMAGRKAEIYLGTAIDRDTVYINGKDVGTTYYRYPPRNYSFTMPKGSVTIAIRLISYGDGGEFAPGKNRFIATDTGTLALDGPWKRKVGVIVPPAPPQTRLFDFPTALYNGMIAPLKGTQIKGIAWYQGESDTGNPDAYGKHLIALIESWRELFQDEELPFVMQQVAHWDHTGPGGSDEKHQLNWETLRNQQKLALDLPNVGLSAGYDVGEWNDLHPQGKRIVGERLARLAYRIAYRESLPPNMFEQYNLGASPHVA